MPITWRYLHTNQKPADIGSGGSNIEKRMVQLVPKLLTYSDY